MSRSPHTATESRPQMGHPGSGGCSCGAVASPSSPEMAGVGSADGCDDDLVVRAVRAVERGGPQRQQMALIGD